MSRQQDYVDALRDILENAHKAKSFVAGMTYAEFETNDEKAYAVYHALAIIGEAARKIPKATRNQYGQVPWEQVTGTRDRLIHDYAGVKIRRIWETVQNDLPPLIATVERMLADLEEQERDKKD